MSSKPLGNNPQSKTSKDESSSATISTSTETYSTLKETFWWQGKGVIFRPLLLLVSLYAAVWIRLNAVRKYGKVIHEFDPWFNFRSTQYLVDNGWEKFSNWYDYESWYPLGRPVGHTVYPGLMVTAATIFEYAQKYQYFWSLNDVCVFLPAGFSIITVLATYGLTFEVTNGNWSASTFAAAIMSVLPAHLMRSVAGGFDNESVAVAAIVVTFYLWVRAVRSVYMSWFFGMLCGLSYVYLVSSWGAYIFALNMIGVHVGILTILMGRFSFRLHLAYSTFYIIGTYGALQFPTVGLQPLRSMEQMGPLAVFGVLQVFAVAQLYSIVRGYTETKKRKVRYIFLGMIVVVVAFLIQSYLPATFFGPLSARVRGLFVSHTKTGNPLVDSVAEHQQTPSRVYWLYFHWTFYMTPIGFLLVFQRIQTKLKSTNLKDMLYVEQSIFLLAFIAISYYFSSRMIRLVLLLSPATSIAAGIVAAETWDWALLRAYQDEGPILLLVKARRKKQEKEDEKKRKTIISMLTNQLKETAKKKKDKKMLTTPTKSHIEHAVRRQRQQEEAELSTMEAVSKEWNNNPSFQKNVSYGALLCIWFGSVSFVQHSIAMSKHLSEPQIMVQIPDPEFPGENRRKIVDDFREAYWWLRDNTPKETRVRFVVVYVVVVLIFVHIFCEMIFFCLFFVVGVFVILCSWFFVFFLFLFLFFFFFFFFFFFPPSSFLLLLLTFFLRSWHGGITVTKLMV